VKCIHHKIPNQLNLQRPMSQRSASSGCSYGVSCLLDQYLLHILSEWLVIDSAECEESLTLQSPKRFAFQEQNCKTGEEGEDSEV
jgi:hypothetical protein